MILNPRRVALSLSFLALAALAPAAEKPRIEVEEWTMSNGMKWLLYERHDAPTIATGWVAHVGSANERPGITGIAHVHEHMMFKGTKMMGVTDFEKDAALDRRIDEVMDQIYREKYWKPDGDPAKIVELQKKADELTAAEKAFIVKD